MGNFNRNNPGSRKREFEAERKTAIRPTISQKIVLGLLFIGALLFFLSSFGHPAVSVEFFFQSVGQGILVLLSIVMVAIAVQDREDKIKQKRKKNRLLTNFQKQKGVLKNRFDLRKNLSSRSREKDIFFDRFQSSLNFAAENKIEQDEVEKATGKDLDVLRLSEELSLKEKLDLENKVTDSQTNLARTLVEGESVSAFPSEWQEFLLENDGKDPLDKLNNMLKNGKHET